jgi:FkbM family methyltransferase
MRVQRLMDGTLRPGANVIDVGANLGYNAVYAARRVRPTGQVLAIEPAADNLAVLRKNIAANGLNNIVVQPVAAGGGHEVRDFFLRGDVSAVNSLFPQSRYGAVTAVEQVRVAPLDDLVDIDPDLVKIDVEGAELEVLAGMRRLLGRHAFPIIVEWHPELQQMAGYRPDALPRVLLDHGFTLHVAWHTHLTKLNTSDIDGVVSRLCRARRPVELLARR